MSDFETKVIHAGIEPEPNTGAVMTPIFQTSTYAQAAPGEHKGYEYSRTDNPTRTVLQAQLAALEGGDHALVFASGLAATDAVLNLLQSGDHVIAGDDLYGGTYRLFEKVATYRGLKFSFIDLSNEALLRSHLRDETKLIWFETPTNPMLNVFDIERIAQIGHEHGALVVVDNTFMSPYFQNPLQLGADIVMHSMTKYINGHSDVVMGSLILKDREMRAPRKTWSDPNFAAPRTLYARLKFLQNAVGAVPGPFDCWLVLRGIKTLAVRMQRHGENALKVAEFLEGHPKVERAIYPGLASHPGQQLAARQMRGFGGMLTFLLKGGLEDSRRFLSSLKLFTLAESLGGVESLIEHPAIMTHASVPADIRREIGIHDNLIRVSVGIESAQDLISDLDQALARV
ncbi:MAG TPA: cystathionine gamma-synthase [Fimbriimonadaceae bacterium]|nr:cystathionine gamma-synthase [Fimbriimonadaceae bacterium]